VHSGTVYSTCMYRQLYPLPTLYFSSAINSKMPNKLKGPVKKPPPSPTKAAAAKHKDPPKGPNPAAKRAAVKLKEAPIPVVPATSKTPSPDMKSPARSSQMSGAAHPVTSVEVPTSTRTQNDDNTQEELTMEGGGCCNGSIGLRCLHKFGQENERRL
jgi:hypothetical protein